MQWTNESGSDPTLEEKKTYYEYAWDNWQNLIMDY